MKTIPVRSPEALARVVGEWRATMGKNTINHAVEIVESEGSATITNESGYVMHFRVQKPEQKPRRSREWIDLDND
jgi:hypothetical protein